MRYNSSDRYKHYEITMRDYVCWGLLRLAKINATQQLVGIQIPCVLVNNDVCTRIYPAAIRSYCFFRDSLKILSYKINLTKKPKKNYKRRSSNSQGMGNCAQGILSAALQTVGKLNEQYYNLLITSNPVSLPQRDNFFNYC